MNPDKLPLGQLIRETILGLAALAYYGARVAWARLTGCKAPDADIS